MTRTVSATREEHKETAILNPRRAQQMLPRHVTVPSCRLAEASVTIPCRRRALAAFDDPAAGTHHAR
eukprot:680935-Hanusia_phi.AAC.1